MRVAIRTLALSVAAALFCSITQPVHAQGNDQLATLVSDIEAGREISFPVKYNYYFEDSYGNSTDVAFEDGLVTLSKSTFGFQVTKGYKQSFAIPPEKILELVEQPQQASRLKVKVAIKGVRGNKEIKQDYYFYGPGASAAGDGSISCGDCGDSMDVLYALLTKFRGGQWVRIDNSPAAPPAPAPAPNPVRGGQQAEVSGKYLLQGQDAQIIFVSNTSCILLLSGSRQIRGEYAVTGDILTLNCSATGRGFSFKIQGDRLIADDRAAGVWVRQGGAPVPQSAEGETDPQPPPQRQYDDIAPPPPPPTPAPTISMGQTKSQVIASFGEPQRKAAAGAKEIFIYTDLKMKVTFTNGKVSSIE